MNYEFVVDVLDALAFCFVTPQLLGGTIVGARLRVSESRVAYLLKRAIIGVIKPQIWLRKIDSEVLDKYWQKLWSGGEREPDFDGYDWGQGLVYLGGAVGWFVIAYWLWDWLWHWARPRDWGAVA
jgi:hypothetical protein